MAKGLIRVCHLAKYYAPFRGGIETHVQSIAQAHQQMGLDVTVACINHLGKNGKAARNELFARTQATASVDNGVQVQRFGKFASLWKFDFCRGVASFLKNADQRFDLLHLHVPNPVFCLALARLNLKLPLVVTYHSDIVKQKLASLPFRLIEKAVFGRVEKFIAATAEYAHSSKVLRKYHERVCIIPFGLDLKPFCNPSPAALVFRDELLTKSNGSPLWICVGRFVYYKGFEHAIRALTLCRGRLMMVGNGPLKNELMSLANSLGVGDRVIWHAELSDHQLVGAYHASRALWFPSVFRSEAFGLVQVEAMACGCPVINTRIEGSGVPAVSLDGESGMTIAVGDSRALALAANQLDADSGLRRLLSNGARTRAMREFSQDVMAARTLNLYSDILKN